MVPNNRIQRFLSLPPASKERRRGNSFVIGEGLRPSRNPGRSSDLFGAPREMAWPLFDRPPSDEEVHFHAALFDRMAELRRARRSIWSKIWGFLRGD